jgi:hypothetical protein
LGPITDCDVPSVPLDPEIFSAILAVAIVVIGIAEKLLINEPVSALLALTA